MLIVNDSIAIPEEELSWTFARSGGPGGQNVNKVASKAVLRWEVVQNRSVPPEAITRLLARHPSKTTIDGGFFVVSQVTRDQSRNKDDCREKLIDMIRQSLVVPKARKKTKPSYGSKLRRLETKKRNSVRKSTRKDVHNE